MMNSLFRRARRRATIDTLYGMIVAQARSPSFYKEFGVADTVNGRFDMVLLHLWLVLRRLRGENSEEASATGQGLFDAFCRDMDAQLREFGTGDMKVPKEMRKIGEAFYGRMQAYDRALEHGEGALSQALARNVLGHEDEAAARDLAGYVRQAIASLASESDEAVVQGTLNFPPPAKLRGVKEGAAS